MKAVAPLFLDNFQIENVKILPNKGGKTSILFRVCSADMAADIVRKRYKLKNEDYSIFDQLSNEEFAEYKKLRPHFLKAREDGKRAFFRRATLIVDGIPFPAP